MTYILIGSCWHCYCDCRLGKSLRREMPAHKKRTVESEERLSRAQRKHCLECSKAHRDEPARLPPKYSGWSGRSMISGSYRLHSNRKHGKLASRYKLFAPVWPGKSVHKLHSILLQRCLRNRTPSATGKLIRQCLFKIRSSADFSLSCAN